MSTGHGRNQSNKLADMARRKFGSYEMAWNSIYFLEDRFKIIYRNLITPVLEQPILTIQHINSIIGGIDLGNT
jgi:hypothetical protein